MNKTLETRLYRQRMRVQYSLERLERDIRKEIELFLELKRVSK